MFTRKPTHFIANVILLAFSAVVLTACTSSSASNAESAPPPQALPVAAVTQMSATLYQEYSASLEGSKDIEIRPQVEGYIEKIYVDEGAQVRRGHPLFKINDRIYREQLNNAKGSLAAAIANRTTVQINVSKITPLGHNNIVSDV